MNSHTNPDRNALILEINATAVPWTLCNPEPSAGARHLTALFHLPTTWNDEQNPLARRPRPLNDACRIPLPERGIVLITGPSGSGKSSLLQHIRAHPGVTRPGRFHITTVSHTNRNTNEASTPLDALLEQATGRDELHDAVMNATQSLADAGLNEPFLMLTPIQRLSDGQRHRFLVANALHNIQQHHQTLNRLSKVPGRAHDQRYLVFLDELGTTLDDAAASALARALRRCVNRSAPDVTLIASSNRPDALSELQPDVTVHTNLHHASVHVVRAANNAHQPTQRSA